MRIILSEHGEKILWKTIIQESLNGLSDKVQIIKNYLDKNYLKADIETLDNKSGDLKKQNLVIMLDSKGEPTEHRLSIEELYYKIQEKYKNIIANKEERNKFIWQTINDWFFNKIGKYGTLSR